MAETLVNFFETGVDEMSGIIFKNTKEQMEVISHSFGAKQSKRGGSGTKGLVKINNYPRAMEAKITYTYAAYTSTTDKISAENAI